MAPALDGLPAAEREVDVSGPVGEFLRSLSPRLLKRVRLGLRAFEWLPFPWRFSRLDQMAREDFLRRMETSRFGPYHELLLMAKTFTTIGYAIAQEAQRQGAEILLTSFGRMMPITEMTARKLNPVPEILEMDVQKTSDIERAVKLGEREFAHESACSNGPLDAPAKLEEAPAGQLTHILLSQSRKRRDDAQRAIGPLEDRAFRWRMIDGRIDQLEKVGQRPPGIWRKAITDH